ncbi:hypothetical protein LCGC14_1387710 [marine sediment metagenome]|uniref:BioF2-like acetyltransferase domain-containing protein n=1 Tax=marine sediment metagenome TaxID=412755 RepID=A0A0F9K117_9ZZZZ
MSGPSPGYRSAAYAAALAHLGPLRPLGETDGFVIARDVPGAPGRTDLAGPYPLLCCADWSRLGPAVAALRDAAAGGTAAGRAGPEDDGAEGDRPVSLVLVTDPFCPLDASALSGIFPLCRVLHEHYLIDLAAPLALSRTHRRKLRAAPGLRFEMWPASRADLADLSRLYAGLVARHRIGDLRAFPAESLAHQLDVPGAELVTAWEGETLLGADLYYPDSPAGHEGGVMRAHLSAYSDRGYALSVSYPMMAHAIEALRGRARWLDLGGAPAGGEGVAQFKAGWTAQRRPSFLCGRVLDPAAYAALCPPGADTGYFPAYRAGEFTRPDALD